MKVAGVIRLRAGAWNKGLIACLVFLVASLTGSCRTAHVSATPAVGSEHQLTAAEMRCLAEFRAQRGSPDRSQLAEEAKTIIIAYSKTRPVGSPLSEADIVALLGQPDRRSAGGNEVELSYRVWTKGGQREYTRFVLVFGVLFWSGPGWSVE